MIDSNQLINHRPSKLSRKMTSQQQRRQRQLTLLEQAASHGPYLWSSTDIENALLWFPSASSSDVSMATSSAAAAGQVTTDDKDENSNANDACKNDDMGCQFLRRLLHSPGSHLPRLAPKKQSSSQIGRKRDNAEYVEDFNAREKTAGKKRKRDFAHVTDSSFRSSGEKDILSTVLKGYYQLFLRRHAVSSTMNTNDALVAEPCANQIDATETTTSKESIHAEMATSQLQRDLNSIVLSRLRTNELYKATLHQHSNNIAQNTPDKAPRDLQMNILIDQYMTHPTTSILRAYTSRLFDRHTSLAGENNTNNSFLHKLLGLAKGNDKIQQVVVLFLLEPLRRLFVKKLEKCYCKKEETVRSLDRTRCDSEDKQSTMEDMTSKISLFPLLTSSVPWSDIPHEDIEDVCSRNPMPEIIEFIIQSASSSHQNNSNDAKEKISWWSLPSPLMCVACQMYFPLANAYLRHWITAALVAHGNLYHFDPVANNHTNEPQSRASDIIDNGNSFESAMLRLRHIRQTSKRLESLFDYVFSEIQNESQGSFEKEAILGFGDAEESSVPAEDLLFRQGLSWDAIRKAIEK